MFKLYAYCVKVKCPPKAAKEDRLGPCPAAAYALRIKAPPESGMPKGPRFAVQAQNRVEAWSGIQSSWII